ncbi:MAG TPA: hypothetical protein VKA15_24505 [Isosphaeraceae bacterium]|nr:hypothetical protein [Isosphaeraceae bacterium]
MTNSALKLEVLQVLSVLIEHCPDVRLGQLIVNRSSLRAVSSVTVGARPGFEHGTGRPEAQGAL